MEMGRNGELMTDMWLASGVDVKDKEIKKLKEKLRCAQITIKAEREMNGILRNDIEKLKKELRRSIRGAGPGSIDE